MSEETGLIVIPEGGALEVFTGGGLDPLLAKIEAAARKHVPDLTTDKGRKAIASNAHNVSRSKVVIEKARKELVADMVKQKKEIDTAGKHSSDFCDSLRDELRDPLTKWEDAEALRVAAAKLAAEVESDHADAILEYKLFVLEKAEAARVAEAERVRVEEEQQAEVERVRLARIEEDKRIAAEATAEAERVAAKQIADAEEERQQAELDKIAAEQREKVAAEMAEERRIAAEDKAEQDRLAAIQRTKDEAEELARQKEEDRLLLEKIERTRTEKKAADKAHQRKVNQEALKCFTEHGIDETVAKGIIEIIAKGKIDNVSINY